MRAVTIFAAVITLSALLSSCAFSDKSAGKPWGTSDSSRPNPMTGAPPQE